MLAAQAAPGCNITGISGTWIVQVVSIGFDEYAPVPPTFSQTTCWFVISKPRNLGIHCEEPWVGGGDFFALFQDDFDFKPWHQIVGPNTDPTQTVDRRFPTPKRCQWTIVDRNGLDFEAYEVHFAPNMQSLSGYGNGYQDKHFGSTEPVSVTFNGVRQ